MPANAVHCAAACMSGGAANHVPPPAADLAARLSLDAPSAPPIAETKRSAWRHSTPFGVPVVPPVQTRHRSSGDGVGRVAVSAAPSRTASSKLVLPASGATP